MTLGTLRDQIIYPDCKEDMLKRGITDKDLEQSMAQVGCLFVCWLIGQLVFVSVGVSTC